MHGDFLLFDGACSFCGDTARTIQDASDGRLQVRSLTDPDVVALVRGSGTELAHRPTLVRVSTTGVRVWTGAAMVARLVSSLGLRSTRRVLHALGTAAQGPSVTGQGMDRRTLLRGVASGAGLALGAVFLGASPASASSEPEATSAADRAVLLAAASRWSGRQETAKVLRQRGFEREPVDRVVFGSAADGVVMAFYGKGDQDPGAAAVVTTSIVGSEVQGRVEFVTADLDALFDQDGALVVAALDVVPLTAPGEVGAASASSYFRCMMLCLGATCATRAATCSRAFYIPVILACIAAACGSRAYTCHRRCD